MTPRLGVRLVAVAAAIAVVFVIAGAVLAWRSERAERDRIAAEAAIRARSAAAEADQFLRDRIALLDVIAAGPAVRSADPERMLIEFAGLPANRPTLAGVTWADLQGNVRARTPPQSPTPVNIADRDYFRAVVATSQPFIGGAVQVRTPSVNVPSIVVAVPARNTAGALTGVLANTITLDQLTGTLGAFTSGGKETLLVVDRDNRLIVDVVAGSADQDVSSHPLVARARADGSGVVAGVTGPRGDRDRLVAFARVPAAEWLVFVDQPAGRVFADARRAFFMALAALIGVAFAGVGGAAWTARRLDRHDAARRRAERELRGSRDQLDAILQGVDHAIAVQDTTAGFLYANDAAARLMGYPTARELCATPARRVLERFVVLDAAGQRLQAEQLPVSAALRGDPVRETVMRYRVPETGEERWSVVKATPVFDDLGKVRFAVSIFSDVTAHRQAEVAERLLAEASGVLASSLDYETTLAGVARLAVAEFADACSVFMADDGGWQCLAAHHDPPQQEQRDDADRPSLEPAMDLALARVLGGGVAELLADIPDGQPGTAAPAPRSALVVPMVARGRVLGALLFAVTASGRRYRPEDLALAEELGRRAALAVDNARLYQETRAAEEQARRQTERVSALAAASRAFAEASLDSASGLDAIARYIAQATGDGCIIRLLSDDAEYLTPVALAHADPEAEALARDILSNASTSAAGRLPGRVAESGEALLLPQPDQELADVVEPTFRPYIERFKVSSILLLPLMVQGRAIGTLTLSREGAAPPYTREDQRFLHDLADRAAVAIDNVRLYAAERRARDDAVLTAGRIARLQEATAALSEALTPEHVANVIVDQGLAALGAFAGRILLLSPDGAELTALRSVGYPDDVEEEWRRLPVTAAVPPADAVRSSEPVWIESVDAVRDRYPLLADTADRKGTGALAAIPLRAEGRVIGAMSLSFHGPRVFTEEDHAFALALGRQCAQALERTRLFVAERAARAEAEAANRAKDEFLSTLSHELRTPLTSVLGWTRLLRSRRLDPTAVAEALETIERSARAQARLVEDLLDVSRIIAGKLSLNLDHVDLREIVEAAAGDVRPTAAAKGIDLQVSLPPAVTGTIGDPVRLQQVFANLLTNAVKFTPEGGRIEVQMACPDGMAAVSVRDTGIGIDPDFLPHVFERFRQADASSTRQHGGLGLGLAIVRHLVELHGGSVRAESEGEGRGATFTVILPVSDRYAPGPRLHDPSDALPDARLQGIRVLVVEDEPDARGALSALLGKYGADVTACASAVDALGAVERARPDVLVSDIGMLDEDGYAFIQRVRSLGSVRGGDVPALVLTAHAGPEDRARALAVGYTHHLPKPADPDDLTRLIAQLGR